MPDEQEIVYLVRIKGEPAILKCVLLSETPEWIETTSGDGGRSLIWGKFMFQVTRSLEDAVAVFKEAQNCEYEVLQGKIEKLWSLKPVVEDRTVPRPELPPLDESPI